MSEHTHDTNPDNNLRIGFLINTTFVVLEFVAGLFANSLALISDAAHNLTDSMSILFAYFASRFSKRSANTRQTYGYGRAAILAALINSTILAVTSITIYREAYSRLFHPQPVHGGIVAVIALVGIISNGLVAFIAARNKNDLNSKTVFLSNIVDTISSFSAMVAGILIIFTKQTWIDPAISFFIATMLLYAAWKIIRQAASVLMEGVPKGIDAQAVRQSLLSMTDVTDIDDLHIWTVGSNEAALSCHIVTNLGQLSQSVALVSQLKQSLRREYGITHATIEIQTVSGSHDHERTDEGL